MFGLVLLFPDMLLKTRKINEDYMLHKYLFIIGHSLKDLNFPRCYNYIKKCEYGSYETLKKYQEKNLSKIIDYSYETIPYYHKLFNKLDLRPEDVRSIEDLTRLPILTKKIIRSHQKDFIPFNLKDQKYLYRSTAGSTGHPLRYRSSKRDKLLGFVLMYANWGYAGYELGDKIGVIAGSSLLPSSKSNLEDKIKAFVLNEKWFSSFDLTDTYMEKILSELNKLKPRYLRGYASALYLFAKYIKDNNLKIDFVLRGIFTTAEVLYNHQRAIIEYTFKCPVFDQYGLNDGGISAYECEGHKGLHIDMARSIMEIVDASGKQLEGGEEGHILATSMFNYAMPFIRYDTGDMGILSSETCDCGRELPLLKGIRGRTSDFIYTPKGNKIHGEFFSHIFWEFDWVKQFQVVQRKPDEVIIRLVPDNKDKINQKDLEQIEKIVTNRIEITDITLEIRDEIEPTQAGKLKFIIQEANTYNHEA